MTRLVFLDTETTGLTLSDDIWEVAMIIRDPGRPDLEFQAFVEHDLAKAARLPESFRADHDARYDPNRALNPSAIAEIVSKNTDSAHIVGAVPNFDTERLALLMEAHGVTPHWHYHLIDIETLAVGYAIADRGYDGGEFPLPWDSDDVSRAVGVEPPTEERHTALGDARWARDVYDAVMSGART